MDYSLVAWIGRETLLEALYLVAPVVIVSLVLGLVVSIGQTVTGIQEQTLSFAPRIIAAAATIVALLPWYLTRIQAFATELFQLTARAVQ
jgi:flagellar biosynthetic protein FliQ